VIFESVAEGSHERDRVIRNLVKIIECHQRVLAVSNAIATLQESNINEGGPLGKQVYGHATDKANVSENLKV
jgi:hypothetical protein